MKFIKDPVDGIAVVHTHLTNEEADEISAFIERYKAEKQKKPVVITVDVSDSQELDFLLALFQRLNMKWTVSEPIRGLMAYWPSGQ